VSACSYTTCGDQVRGPQLSNVIQSRSTLENCGPEYDVHIKGEVFPMTDAGVRVCVIEADGPCEPPALGVTIYYYPCLP
jgi:hypothetical protein